MEPETEDGATIAEVIAEVAAEVIEEQNAATERAEIVSEALTEVALQELNRQRLEDIHREFETRHETMRAEFHPAIERIGQCEQSLATLILETTALRAVMAEATLLLSTLAPSNNHGAGEAVQENQTLVENPAEAETPEQSPQNEVKRPRVTRHLV